MRWYLGEIGAGMDGWVDGWTDRQTVLERGARDVAEPRMGGREENEERLEQHFPSWRKT